MFYVYNLKTRKDVLTYTKVTVNRPVLHRVAGDIAALTSDDLSRLLQIIDNGGHASRSSAASQLFNQCKFITGKIVGSQHKRQISRKHVKATITALGMSLFFITETKLDLRFTGAPALWITVNPPDVHSPAVIGFAHGSSYPLVYDSNGNLSTISRRRLVARNPVACARYFRLTICSILDHLFRPDRDGVRIGILGRVRSYYATIETQGRGTLHAHMLVWLHDLPPPSEIERRFTSPEFTFWRHNLVRFVDTVIKNDFEGIHDYRGETRANGELDEVHICQQVPPNPFEMDADTFVCATDADRVAVSRCRLVLRRVLHNTRLVWPLWCIAVIETLV